MLSIDGSSGEFLSCRTCLSGHARWLSIALWGSALIRPRVIASLPQGVKKPPMEVAVKSDIRSRAGSRALFATSIDSYGACVIASPFASSCPFREDRTVRG